MMDRTIQFADEGAEVDVGPHGYDQRMVVYRNDPADRENLEASGATRAYAEFALSAPHRLVGFSSEPGGRGAWQVLLLDDETAARYPEGTDVRFHFRKSREIGFGDLVAITSDPEPIAAPTP